MASNSYDFTFVLRKQLQRKILLTIAIIISVSLLICLFLTYIMFPIKVNSKVMEPEYEEKALVFVAPMNMEKPLFWQHHNIQRGSVVYLNPEDIEKSSFTKNIINEVVGFITFRQYTPYANKNKITGSSTIRRVVGLPGDTIYMKDYILYVKPANTQHFLTEYELADKMYEVVSSDAPSHDLELGVPGNMSEISLLDNEYFVLADDRLTGIDSRIYGPISASRIGGKAILRYFPFSSFSSL